MTRCLNDIFGYCLHEPKEIPFDSFKVVLDAWGGTTKVPFEGTKCLNNHHTCPHYRIFTSTYTPRPIIQTSLSLT